MTNLADVREEWSDFLIEVESAHNYPMVNSITGGSRLPNPVLERILPTLLHVKATASFDRALEVWMVANGITLTSGYRADLNGRIRFLSDKGYLPNASSLHAVRAARNSFAHNPNSMAGWDELKTDIACIHGAMEHLKIVNSMPTFEAKATQHAMTGPTKAGAICSQKFEFTVEGSDGHGGTIEWERHIMKNEESREE